ncbi:MAG: flagellar motor protein MotB [Lachnoclostridium sp.]|nr:flagellar motor protein MotB [Lachnospira sp.]MCM1246829.1 flagellar motor protein MotB [Lachnoclostridium sp.]MCM1534763.1 flagellar motor protein MotB [Clostridium sp.]
MAKRKEEAPPAGSPAWMATFSDLMNLLLCFFVMLFSMSTMDEAKLREVVASMNSTFSIFEAGATAIGDGFLVSNGMSQLNELSDYISNTGMSSEDNSSDQMQEDKEKAAAVQEMLENNPGAVQEMLEEQQLQDNEALAEAISEEVAESNMSDQIEVSFTSQYVQLSMRGALLFDSGSAEIVEESKRVLDKAGSVLERYSQGIIEIEGHTDNVPIHTREYADNEELSSARALSVFYYFTENTSLNPVCFRHAGMGERVPIADNSTPEGRSKNRRVEIRIYTGTS